MTDQEVNGVVQYVTSSTSYGRETVAEILGSGFTELINMGTSSSRSIDRETLLGYVCQWTIKWTGHPEPLVCEVLGCAGRWMDAIYEQIVRGQPALLQDPDV